MAITATANRLRARVRLSPPSRRVAAMHVNVLTAQEGHPASNLIGEGANDRPHHQRYSHGRRQSIAHSGIVPRHLLRYP